MKEWEGARGLNKVKYAGNRIHMQENPNIADQLMVSVQSVRRKAL